MGTSSAYEGYGGLRVSVTDGVAVATLDHPPINLLDATLIADLDRLGRALESDPAVRVVVLESADPAFFIAHADVTLIQQLAAAPPPPTDQVGAFHVMVERLRTLPQATIVKLEGIARGGGSEVALSLDMRFAALGRAVLGQPEVAVGIIPGGSGTQRLARLAGRGRALEIVLGCDDFPADLAERYGWVNRALPADELGPFVDALARRIASFPREAIVAAKAAVLDAEPPWREGLLREGALFDRVVRSGPARERMTRFLAMGGQTRAVESGPLAAALPRLAPAK
jgi:enoyl-CoA hydratase/carnithine racemase